MSVFRFCFPFQSLLSENWSLSLCFFPSVPFPFQWQKMKETEMHIYCLLQTRDVEVHGSKPQGHSPALHPWAYSSGSSLFQISLFYFSSDSSRRYLTVLLLLCLPIFTETDSNIFGSKIFNLNNIFDSKITQLCLFLSFFNLSQNISPLCHHSP